MAKKQKNESKELSRIQQTIQSLAKEVRSISVKSSKPFYGKPPLRHPIERTINILGSLSSFLIPIFTLYLAFSNFISIPPAHSLKLDDPLSIPFVIQNNSFINIYQLVIDAQIISLEGDTLTNRNITIKNYHLINLSIPLLNANSAHTIIYPSGSYVGEKFTRIRYADIQINISYKALFFPKSFTEQFRFVAVPKQDGLYEYYPVQLGR
jgi:hypothetical protein